MSAKINDTNHGVGPPQPVAIIDPSTNTIHISTGTSTATVAIGDRSKTTIDKYGLSPISPDYSWFSHWLPNTPMPPQAFMIGFLVFLIILVYRLSTSTSTGEPK
jgi:hypothetical protein